MAFEDELKAARRNAEARGRSLPMYSMRLHVYMGSESFLIAHLRFRDEAQRHARRPSQTAPKTA